MAKSRVLMTLTEIWLTVTKTITAKNGERSIEAIVPNVEGIMSESDDTRAKMVDALVAFAFPKTVETKGITFARDYALVNGITNVYTTRIRQSISSTVDDNAEYQRYQKLAAKYEAQGQIAKAKKTRAFAESLLAPDTDDDEENDTDSES